MSIRPLLPHKEGERGIPPNSSPVNKNGVVEPGKAERPLGERIMGQPDYADILSRSLDMLDRKYDFTPEGRCEAKKLALELELMNPAPAKPAKDFFGQTVALVRRFRDAEQQESDGASIPPAVDYYGHPIKTHVVPPPWADKQDALPPARGTATSGGAHPNPSASRSEPPTVPDPETCSSGRGEPGVGEPALRPLDQTSSESPQLGSPQKPESKRNAQSARRKTRQRTAPSSSLQNERLSPPARPPDSGPDDEHHEGHQTDWYAPPSWSSVRTPDSFPSRKEKLQRKIRGLTNSAFRRLQHQNSRGFWNKGLQKLTP